MTPVVTQLTKFNCDLASVGLAKLVKMATFSGSLATGVNLYPLHSAPININGHQSVCAHCLNKQRLGPA